MLFDPVLLSRIQFAWVIGRHILLPAFTVLKPRLESRPQHEGMKQKKRVELNGARSVRFTHGREQSCDVKELAQTVEIIRGAIDERNENTCPFRVNRDA
jgi:hypothetical protein